jgi:hypothetical protein
MVAGLYHPDPRCNPPHPAWPGAGGTMACLLAGMIGEALLRHSGIDLFFGIF